jgi:phosphate transport system substrate-binding protein
MPLAAAALLLFCGVSRVAADGVEIDPGLPAYQKRSGVSGTLSSIGSDTLNNVMTLWAESFQRQYPGVRVQIEGKGSSTAPPALIAGTAQLGPMSRPMKANEIDDFEKRYGHKPTQIKVAVDALAVYVNKDNPIEALDLERVDAIFSKTRSCGHPRSYATWGDLGLTGAWASRAISLYGRNSASGTYGFFKDHALCGGDYRDQVKEQPGSASVVQGVAADLGGIGYSGTGYRTSGVRSVPLAARPGTKAFGVSQEEAMSGEYPLARFLYVYVNKSPGKPLDPLVGELVKFICTREGQQVVVKDGYLPLSASQCETELAKIE